MVKAAARAGGRRKLSDLEKNRILLRFMKMNEDPENFALTNQYMKRNSDHIQKSLLLGLKAAMEVIKVYVDDP